MSVNIFSMIKKLPESSALTLPIDAMQYLENDFTKKKIFGRVYK